MGAFLREWASTAVLVLAVCFWLFLSRVFWPELRHHGRHRDEMNDFHLDG
jgi:hypothetical protein